MLEALQRSTILAFPDSKGIAGWLQVLSHLGPEHGGIAMSVPEVGSSDGSARGAGVPYCGFLRNGGI